MKVVLFLTLFCVQASLVWPVVESGYVEECKALAATLIKEQMKMVTECTASLKFKDAKEKKLKQSCIMKCVMTKSRVLDAEGHVDLDQSVKVLKEMLPTEMWEKAESLLKPCEPLASKITPGDETCKSYDPLINCGTKAFTQLCK